MKTIMITLDHFRLVATKQPTEYSEALPILTGVRIQVKCIH